MSERERVTGILLAAGTASRFGGRKLLHPLADGSPIGLASWRCLQSVLSSTVVVVRPGDEALQQVYSRAGARVITCAQAERGMGHSLACGVAATAAAHAWVVALADMPSVAPRTIRLIADELTNGAGIVVPIYRGKRGHPVGFAAHHREALLNLSGDQGARAILEANAGQVVRLDVEDAGILQDVDTREDAERVARPA